MKIFYEYYNLSANHFAKLLGMSIKTLRKYEQGKKLTEKSIRKIELGKKTIMKHCIVFPSAWRYTVFWNYSIYKKKLSNIDQIFKELYEREGAL